MDAHPRLGQELLQVHGRLRARVDALTSTLETGLTDVDAFADSCLAFCRSLRRHHVGEDQAAFGVIRRHAPDLADALDALSRDHEFLDPLLDRLEALATDGPPGGDHVAVQRELDGIAAVLANHLAYEERVLVSVLDRLDVAPGSADDQALRAPLRGVLEPDGT